MEASATNIVELPQNSETARYEIFESEPLKGIYIAWHIPLLYASFVALKQDEMEASGWILGTCFAAFVCFLMPLIPSSN